jgi:transposase
MPTVEKGLNIVKEFSLSEEQQTRLRCELRQPSNAHVYRRAAGLLALHEGRPAREVASFLGVTRQTVYNWLNCRAQGEQDLNLEDAPRAGRPSLWNEELDVLLEQAFEKCPADFGHVAPHWTAALLRKHFQLLERPDISEETIRRRLRHLGYNWKDGRYVRLESEAERARRSAEVSSPQSGCGRQLEPERCLNGGEFAPEVPFSNGEAMAA